MVDVVIEKGSGTYRPAGTAQYGNPVELIGGSYRE
jgi:hypothetical protein